MPTTYKIGPFRLDTKAELLFRGSEPIALGQRAVALLRALIERAGTPVSKDALIEGAWSGLAVEESNLTVQIAALRRVFQEEAGGERWIETLPRRGYRFVGPVVATEEIGPAAATMEATPALTLSNKPSIAVLPFQNMSGDPEQEYFADGMVDEIITGLSRIKWLSVISRNSTFIYKNKPVAIKEVADKLGVRYVLEGGVRKAGNRVRITTQLIDGNTDTHLWAEQYDRVLEDVFALQDEMTMCVIGAIEPSLRKAEINRVKRQRPTNLNAYDLLLRAMPFVLTHIPSDSAIAIPLLEDALALEPDYAAAHAFLSRCLHHRFARAGRREEDRIAAIQHAHAAVAYGSDDATALAVAAHVIALDEHDTATALKLFERALELSNSNIFAINLSAIVLALMGKAELAIERAERAIRLSPFDSYNFRSHHALAIAYFSRQRYQDAVDAARKAVDYNRRFSVGHAYLAAALLRAGRAVEARSAARDVLEQEPTFTIRGLRGAELEPAVFGSITDALRELGLPE